MLSLKRIFSRKRRYDDIAASIEEHLQERTEELIDEGMPRRQAERTARREFGNVTLVRERSREAWQWPAIDSLWADLKLTFRRLKRAPAFAATAILTLAIGIGANTTVFSVVDNVLLKPLPYPASDQLVSLWLDAPGAQGMADFNNGLLLSPSMYFTFLEHNQSFESMGIWTTGTANVTGIAQPEEVRTELLSDGVLQTLNVPPAVGRWLSHADQDPHGAKTVMLSYGYWQQHFGGDRSVIGRNIQVDSQPYEIVGVMPRRFTVVDHQFDLILPLAFDRNHLTLAPFGFDGIARLKPGVTLAQANADIARLLPVWMDSWSNGPGSNSHYYEVWKITPNFRSLKQKVVGSVSSVLWIVMATVALVMLIACTNVANLLLVRAESRRQELSIRAALGASRARVARELIFESVTLGLIGGVVAIAFAYAGLHLLAAIVAADTPRITEVSLNPTTLGFTFLLSLLSGLVFGAIPALKYVRAQASVMTGNTRTASAGRDRQRSRDILVIAQVAMALVLLVSALLMIRTFTALTQVKPGFADPQHLQTMRIAIPDSLIRDPEMVMHTQNNIVDKLAAIPGVTSVGFASDVPMDGLGFNWDEIRIEGKSYENTFPPLRMYSYTAPGYFHAMGTRLVAGRDFTWTDIYGLRPVIIVSENFAIESWGSAAAAIGKRLRESERMPWVEVIGVAENVYQQGISDQPPAIMYWPAMLHDPYSRQPVIDVQRSATFALRTNRAGSGALINEIQQAVWSVNGNLPVASVRTMQQIYSQSMERTSFTLMMLAIAGSMALLLGTIGIYGVISYSVSQRKLEMGIRLALGAQKSSLKWMFVRSALILTGIGVVIGIGAAVTVMKGMKSLLFGISPLDPFTYITVCLLLLAAAALASYLPARRAAAVDPVEALRAE